MASFLYSGKMKYLSSIVFHTVILKMLSKEAKSRNVASFLYSEIMENLSSILYSTLLCRKCFQAIQNEEMWLRFYVEYKIGVCIIDTIPHCHAEMLSKGAKSRNVALFLYSGRTEYVSSIVFHTVILNKLSKEAKSRHFSMAVWNTIDDTYSNFFLYIVTKPHFLIFASFQSIFTMAVWNTIDDR